MFVVIRYVEGSGNDKTGGTLPSSKTQGLDPAVVGCPTSYVPLGAACETLFDERTYRYTHLLAHEEDGCAFHLMAAGSKPAGRLLMDS